MDSINVKTVTEIKDGKITISSSYRADGETPTILRADLVETPTILNKVDVAEGELALTHIDSGIAGKIDDDGNLVIEVEDDDASKYSLVDGNLTYSK